MGQPPIYEGDTTVVNNYYINEDNGAGGYQPEYQPEYQPDNQPEYQVGAQAHRQGCGALGRLVSVHVMGGASAVCEVQVACCFTAACWLAPLEGATQDTSCSCTACCAVCRMMAATLLMMVETMEAISEATTGVAATGDRHGLYPKSLAACLAWDRRRSRIRRRL